MASSKASPTHGVAITSTKKNGHIAAVIGRRGRFLNMSKRQNEQTYPIETQHMLLCEAKRRALVMPDDVVSILDSALIANAIIKDAKAERRLRALSIARRLQYCLSA
jgi:hypothetical protein